MATAETAEQPCGTKMTSLRLRFVFNAFVSDRFEVKSTSSHSLLALQKSNSQQLTQMPDRPDRQGRRRPFSTWMKKLANFKGGSSTAEPNSISSAKRNTYQMKASAKKQNPSKNNNPY